MSLASTTTPPLSASNQSFRVRLVAVYAALAVLNIGAWLWALSAFHDKPSLLAVALVIYSLGLRHAVDADHIAAIDNVTRKLMQDHQRPVAVGFYFALGHSTIVVLVTAGIVSAATFLGGIQAFKEIGGVISASVSAVFLLAIAAMNIMIFLGLYRAYRQVRSGQPYLEEDLGTLLDGRGFLARILKPLFKLISRSWHMFPLGFLFGLGFDTATEVAVFGVTAAQASHGVALSSVLVFPVLFAAGMSLVDTTDGVLMLGAYEWAFVSPVRKLYYNMVITLVSVLVAVLIGLIQLCSLLHNHFGLRGAVWDWFAALEGSFNNMGCLIIGMFVMAWVVSLAIWRVRKLDDLTVQPPRRP
jgi:high-affinity nickel-transport protein